MNEPEEEILVRALTKWGPELQEEKMLEEMAELQLAILNRSVYRPFATDVIDEIADVYIMIHQLAYVYGIEEVNEQIEYKVDRLETRL